MKRIRTFASAMLAIVFVLASIPFSVCAETAEETQKGVFLPEDCSKIAVVTEDYDLNIVLTAVDGNKTYYFAHAVVDGRAMYIKLSDTIYSHFDMTEYGVEKVYENATAVKFSDKEALEKILWAEFMDIPCKYEINADGEYTLIAFDGLSEDKACLDSEEETPVFIYEAMFETKSCGEGVYSLGDYSVKFDENSRLVIKSYDDDGEEVYKQYTNTYLPDMAGSLYDVSMILINDPESDVETVGCIFAEADELFEEYVEQYIISYELCGGDGVIEDQIKKKNVECTLYSDVPYRADHRFLGWATRDGGDVVYGAGDIYTENKAITLYAVWEEAIEIDGITLDKEWLELYVSEKATLVATVLPEDAYDKTVTFVSSDPSVASVTSDGTVKGKSDGHAVITATTADGTFSASCEVNVRHIDVFFNGAQIRTEGTQGLRYVFTIDRKLYDSLYHPTSQEDTGLGFGTVIIPQRYFDKDYLYKNSYANVDGKKYSAKVVPAVKLYSISETSVSFTVCITHITEKNYKENYVVVPYVTFLNEYGKETTYYGYLADSLSVFDVAEMMIDDTSVPVEQKEYLNEKVLKDTRNETFLVTSTEHYGYETEPSFEKDTVYGTRYSSSGMIISPREALTLEELGLEGESDDYFLAKIELSVKRSADAANANGTILSAHTNYQKKSILCTGKTKVIPETTDKNGREYYINGDENENKVMSGHLDFNGIEAYLDEYAIPPHVLPTGNITENMSPRFIEMTGFRYGGNTSGGTAGDTATGGTTTAASKKGYFFTNHPADFTGKTYSMSAVGAYDVLTHEFIASFPEIYYCGEYELDVYDSDGNGYADYVFVKPMSFLKIDSLSEPFCGIMRNGDVMIPYSYINTYDCTVEGAQYDKGDFVLAYVSDTSRYVKVYDTVQPENAYIDHVRETDDGYYVFLSNGKASNVSQLYNKVREIDPFAFRELPSGIPFDVYYKNGILLYFEETDKAINAIILPGDDGLAEVFTAQAVIDGYLYLRFYVKAVVDGVEKMVMLSDTAVSYYDIENGMVHSNYPKINKIKSEESVSRLMDMLLHVPLNFTVDEDGRYTFTEINYNMGDWYLNTDTEGKVLVHSPFANITCDDEGLCTVSVVGTVESMILCDNTQIVIKAYDDDEEAYITTYTANTFPKNEEIVLNEVVAVFENDTSSNTEKLVYLYAEMK